MEMDGSLGFTNLTPFPYLYLFPSQLLDHHPILGHCGFLILTHAHFQQRRNQVWNLPENALSLADRRSRLRPDQLLALSINSRGFCLSLQEPAWAFKYALRELLPKVNPLGSLEDWAVVCSSSNHKMAWSVKGLLSVSMFTLSVIDVRHRWKPLLPRV